MKLKDTHVLVDGYNLAKSAGTGIKTYGLTLIESLRQLGARVSVLWGLPRARRGSPRAAMLWNGALDHRPLRHDRGVLGAAMRALLFGKVRAEPLDTDIAGRPPRSGSAPAHLAAGNYCLPARYALFFRLFRQLGVAPQVCCPRKVDVWHATTPLPLTVKGARTVITVHDAIPLKLPWATLESGSAFRRTVRKIQEKGALIITVSEQSKKDLVDLAGVDPERIRVTYQPCPAVRRPDEATLVGTLARYGLERGRYFLFVGAIEPKKNVGRLLRAVAEIETDLPLVIAGGKAWLWEKELALAPQLTASGRLKLLGFVPREDLDCLYAGALFFTFPSLYEGFGLPPLEAMAHGCPVIASSAGALPEVCGEAALYVDPLDVRDITGKMRTLLKDAAARSQLTEAGRRQVSIFSPESYREKIAGVYEEVLS